MISAWNLIWIIPICMTLGFMLAALLVASGDRRDDDD